MNPEEHVALVDTDGHYLGRFADYHILGYWHAGCPLAVRADAKQLADTDTPDLLVAREIERERVFQFSRVYPGSGYHGQGQEELHVRDAAAIVPAILERELEWIPFGD